ncbi:patatin family protein [Vibrio sp. UCD-FRSSP16_10]|uniref:patatin-like phospholipase family protein n=1 Tax=unclassified Vibrio TaxID=2614977 RepID=UPI0008002BFD|nr:MULTISPECIES: patatin-like phospholipase family protein [unclassified Vibrio]OBT16990.1 patatin family protein [Vibrio sp. UCD-FRSSP16_30]OBT21981.1 patatin family protein [Vibrio sp. UCD-FRSSP16_10]
MLSKCTDKSSLVVQGGGQKGAFAAGVLDTFIAANYDPFSIYIGTSAGALNVSSFVTKQPGLGLDFILNYTTQDRFFDFQRLVQKKKVAMDLDWAFQFVHSGEFPLDLKKGAENLGNEREALACVTHVQEMKDYYFPIFSEHWYDILRATCAIPMLYHQEIEIDGANWVDGGVSATIPVQEAYRRGACNIVAITTEPVIERSSKFKASLSIEPIDKFKLDLSRGIEPYLNRFSSAQSREKMKNISDLFLDRINQLKERHPFTKIDSLPKNWLPDAEKLSEMMAYHSQRLNIKSHTPHSIEMLFNHYMNHSAISDFMNTPPEGVTITEITPIKSLNSSGLLSHKDDILADYEIGVLAGKEFLSNTL